MATCNTSPCYQPLKLPAELADLTGLLQADLQAIVAMVASQADAQLLLTRREIIHLQRTLWNRLVESINSVAEPLTAEAR